MPTCGRLASGAPPPRSTTGPQSTRPGCASTPSARCPNTSSSPPRRATPAANTACAPSPWPPTRSEGVPAMAQKAVVSLITGMEDPERVMIAFLVAVGAAEAGRPTLMFLTKETVRLVTPGVAVGVACGGRPPLPEPLDRYAQAGGTYLVCPICFNARKLDADQLLKNAELGGTVPMWQWIGDDGATTFSY